MRNCEKCGKLLEDDELCTCEVETIESKKIIYQDPKKDMWKVILTAIIYPAIVIGISFGICNTLTGFGIAVLLGVVGALCIYFGGFTLLVIPLPFIYLCKIGCINKHLALWKRILLGMGAFISLILAIVFAGML